MSSDISYDPVSAIDENEAVGLTADIFLDIRQTMKIPLQRQFSSPFAQSHRQPILTKVLWHF